jgi:hypothetical protein
MHSLAGGTGSGVGTFITQVLLSPSASGARHRSACRNVCLGFAGRVSVLFHPKWRGLAVRLRRSHGPELQRHAHIGKDL